MAGMINALEAEILDHIFGKATYTAPSNWFVGASTTTPDEDGANFTEPVGNGYARVSTAPADWNAAVEGAPSLIDNANTITFPTDTGSWGSFTHLGLFSASTGGTVQMWGALGTPKAITTDDVLEVPAGDFDNQLGDPGDTY